MNTASAPPSTGHQGSRSLLGSLLQLIFFQPRDRRPESRPHLMTRAVGKIAADVPTPCMTLADIQARLAHRARPYVRALR